MKGFIKGRYVVIEESLFNPEVLKGAVGKLFDIDLLSEYSFRVDLEFAENYGGDFVWCKQIRYATQDEIATYKANVIYGATNKFIQDKLIEIKELDPEIYEQVKEKFWKKANQ